MERVNEMLRNYFAVAIMAALFIMPGRRAHAADTVALTSLDLSWVEQGWGKPSVDKTVDGHPLTIGGHHFEHGLGTHSPGLFLIDLYRGSRRFSAWVGIDDETAKRGSAEFQVLGDGKLLWSSGVMHGGDPAKRVDIEVVGIRKLALLVGDAGDGFEYDHADWAEAQFNVTGLPPQSLHTDPSTPTLAQPTEVAKPAITSAPIVGARPDTPLLYTITSTGVLPIEFGASGLPKGLKLDRATGRITGVVHALEGNYNVKLRASNINGEASGALTIKVGDAIALTPPLGWNSYDCFGDDVTEAEVLANAYYMKEHLQEHGWEYVVVDYRWYDPLASKAPNDANIHMGKGLAMDAHGRLLPAPNRFPSAGSASPNGTVPGFKPLADQIHVLGLKFGIHVMRGIPREAVAQDLPIDGSAFHAKDAANSGNTCAWCSDMYGVDASKPAGQAWYDSLLRLYASWGVDYIKVDDLSSPYSTLEIEAIHRAIEKCGRAIVLSLSPGETPIEQAAHVRANANLWRISGDFWDNWGAVNHQFDLLHRWEGSGGPGHWPDADMIPLGHLSVSGRSVGPDRRTGLSRDEQMTMISLWSLAPSPLMLGMHMPDNDAWTLALISNDEILAVNQDPGGTQATRLPRRDTSVPVGVEVWKRKLADGSLAVGLFNRVGFELPVRVTWQELGIKTAARIRNLWQRTDVSAKGDYYETPVGPHGAVMLRIWP